MGASRTFKPTDEVMEKYKPWSSNDDFKEKNKIHVRDAKLNLLLLCMEPRTNDNNDCLRKIEFNLNYLVNCAEQECNNDAYEQYKEDGEITFCGWDTYDEYLKKDYDDWFDYAYEKLVLFAKVIPTMDYYDENEKFSRKISDIKSLLDDFYYEMYRQSIKKLINELLEFELTGDECDNKTLLTE